MARWVFLVPRGWRRSSRDRESALPAPGSWSQNWPGPAGSERAVGWPRNKHHAEADDEVADEGTCTFKPAARGSAIQVGRFPRAATNYFPSNRIRRRPLRIGYVAAGVVAIPILTPFPDVAGHVVESQGIRQLLPDRLCPEAAVG